MTTMPDLLAMRDLSNCPERDPDRIDGIIDALRDAWKEQPNLRLGQLLSHLCADAGDRMWMVEDEQLLGAILGEIGPWSDGPDFDPAPSPEPSAASNSEPEVEDPSEVDPDSQVEVEGVPEPVQHSDSC